MSPFTLFFAGCLGLALAQLVPAKPLPAGGEVLFFGDSITLGVGLHAAKTERWTAQVAKAEGVVEVNEGKGGRPASALSEYKAVLEAHKGDASIVRLVIALGANDARDKGPDVGARVARDIGTMIDLAHQVAPAWEIIICSPPGIDPVHLQHKEIAELRAQNLREITVALQALAQEKNCPYVSFQDVVSPGSQNVDGVHPDPAGHTALSAAFLNQLAKTSPTP